VETHAHAVALAEVERIGHALALHDVDEEAEDDRAFPVVNAAGHAVDEHHQGVHRRVHRPLGVASLRGGQVRIDVREARGTHAFEQDVPRCVLGPERERAWLLGGLRQLEVAPCPRLGAKGCGAVVVFCGHGVEVTAGREVRHRDRPSPTLTFRGET